MFLSSHSFSYEWSAEYLGSIFQGCIEDAQDGSDFEYCGCYTNNISKNFEVMEIVDLLNSGNLESNRVFKSIVIECMKKSDFQ